MATEYPADKNPREAVKEILDEYGRKPEFATRRHLRTFDNPASGTRPNRDVESLTRATLRCSRMAEMRQLRLILFWR